MALTALEFVQLSLGVSIIMLLAMGIVELPSSVREAFVYLGVAVAVSVTVSWALVLIVTAWT